MYWLYAYKCWDCEITFDHMFPARKPRKAMVCPECGAQSEQDYMAKNVSADVFNPYTEENFAAGPVEVETRKQRDELCDSGHVTYDKHSYARGPKRTPWEKGLTWKRIQNMDSGDQANQMIEEQCLSTVPVEDLPK